MPYTLKQKALLLPQLDVKLGASFSEKLKALAQTEFFKSNDLGAEPLRENIEALHKYVDQLGKGKSAELSEAEVQTAWDGVKDFCDTKLPQWEEKLAQMDSESENAAMLRTYIKGMKEYQTFFEKVAAQEARYDQQPSHAVPEADAAPVPFSPDGAAVYFGILEQQGVVRKMDALADDSSMPLEQRHKYLIYRRAVEKLIRYAKEKNAGRPISAEMEKETPLFWDYIRDNSRQMTQELGAALEQTPADNEKYAAIQSFLIAVNTCSNALTQSEIRERLKNHALQDMLLVKTQKKIQQEIRNYDAHKQTIKVTGSEFEWADDDDEDDLTDPEVREMQETLTDYRWKMTQLEVTYDNDFPAVSQSILNLRRQIPAKALERFQGMESLSDFVQEIHELPVRLDWERRKMVDLGSRVDRNAAEILSSDAAPTDQKEDIRKKLQMLFHQNGGDAQKNMDEINKYLASADISAQSKDKLKELFAQNAPQFAAALDDINVTADCIDHARQLKELQILEGQQALLTIGTIGNLTAYRDGYTERYDEIEQSHDKPLREQLAVMSAQLGKFNKRFVSDTAEYKLFRDALEQAGKTGNLTALYQAAEAYRDAKTAKGKRPSSSWGIGRLEMAENVLELLDSYQKLVTAPVKPIVRPEIPVRDREKPWVKEAEERAAAKAREEEEKERREEEERERQEREREEQERKQAEEEAKAQEERAKAWEEERKKRAQEAEREFLAANKPEPLDLSGEIEPYAPYQPSGNRTIDDLRRGLEVWTADHFDQLPEEQANKVARRMCNIMTRHMTGKPGDLRGFLQEFDREFIDKKQWRPPLEAKNDINMIRMSMSDMVVSYAVCKAKNWLMERESDEYASRDLIRAFRSGLYDVPNGVESFEKETGGKPTGSLSDYTDAYLNFHIFVADWNAAIKGERFDNKAPWDAPAAQMDDEYASAMENIDLPDPDAGNPFDMGQEDPFDQAEENPFDEPQNFRNTYQSMTLEYQGKFINAQQQLKVMKGQLPPEQVEKAHEFFAALEDKISYVSANRDIRIGEALLDMDPGQLQKAMVTYGSDKNLIHAVLSSKESKVLSGRERMQAEANRKIREMLDKLPAPENRNELDFHRQVQDILSKKNEVDDIRAFLSNVEPEILLRLRSRHTNEAPLEEQFHAGLREENPKKEDREVIQAQDVKSRQKNI